MRTLDLAQRKITLEELLRWAMSDPVLIQARDGHKFILEEADSFEEEVAMLGSSERFIQFLKERSQENGTILLDTVEETLTNQ